VLGTSEGQKGDEYAGPHVAPAAFGHHGLFGRGERYDTKPLAGITLTVGTP